MSWFTTVITALTGFFTSLNPMFTALGGAAGILATYLVNKYITRQQAKKDAETAMQAAMDEHAGDGAQSVSDSDSANAQLDSIKQQLADMDAAQAKGKANGP